MDRPAWATVVGILGIIFACFGILGAGKEIIMPKILEMQKEMFASIQKTTVQAAKKVESKDSSSADNKKAAPSPFPFEMFDTMQKMWELPSWFGPFSVVSGSLKALISSFYLLACIWLMLKKPVAIKAFYWAAGASIGLSVIKGMVLLSSLSFMGVAMMVGSVFGALIDVVLIVVVATSDKTAYQVTSFS